MMDCKAMTTPMKLNLKLLSDASSDSVDAMLYHQMISVPDEYETRYLLCCEHIEPIFDGSETCSANCYKAYFEVLEGYN